MSELDDLLGRLPQASKTTTITGFAVGKGDDQLHLAVRSGVVGVPLDQIYEVRRLESPGSTTELVEIDVMDPATIVQIRKVRLFPRGFGGGAGFEAADSGHHTWTIPIHSETATITGDTSRHDMTDDGTHGDEADDSGFAMAEEIWL